MTLRDSLFLDTFYFLYPSFNEWMVTYIIFILESLSLSICYSVLTNLCHNYLCSKFIDRFEILCVGLYGWGICGRQFLLFSCKYQLPVLNDRNFSVNGMSAKMFFKKISAATSDWSGTWLFIDRTYDVSHFDCSMISTSCTSGGI